MIAANVFWLEALRGCEIDRSLPLPFDRRRLSDKYRSGRGTSVSFDFGKDLSRVFLAHASTSNITPEYLTLASYYAFLFKLTNGERDLCIGMNTHGRYKAELHSVIGMFANTIPLRCQIDPHDSFTQLLEHVSVMATHSFEYSYFPLQRILAQHSLDSRPTFLDMIFEFCSIASEDSYSKVMLGDASICIVPNTLKIGTDEIVSKFDFFLAVEYHPADSQLSFTIEASIDLFDAVTINKIGQRFLLMLNQLFEFSVDRSEHPIHQLSLILPDETLLIQSINNTHISLPPATCIHHEFICRANEQPQKMAVELDEQSLTYSELFYYVQRLAVHLLKNHNITSGEIVCQCVERSLSMVSFLEKHLCDPRLPFALFRSLASCRSKWLVPSIVHCRREILNNVCTSSSNKLKVILFWFTG
jgi:non-ribosomal peptide synthetase component F